MSGALLKLKISRIICLYRITCAMPCQLSTKARLKAAPLFGVPAVGSDILSSKYI